MMNFIELMGAPPSPYTRKMLAFMRYRQIPYRVHWSSTGEPPEGYPRPKVPLLPTYFLPDENGKFQAVTDSTPIIRRFEKDYEGRSVIPTNPVLAFLNDLIEDYADEFLTKAMFHYRWAHQADYENAGPLLIHWESSVVSDELAKALSDQFTKHQIDRLYVVGSNDITAPIIEAAYARFIGVLDKLITLKGFVLGARPGSADFAICGQLSQLAIVEPTSAKITRDISARVRAWVDRTEDLTGLSPADDDWFDVETAKTALQPFLGEVGRTYAPVALANTKAIMAGEKIFETTVDGSKWTQPTFKYQAKTLGWIRDAYFALSSDDKVAVDDILMGTGCEALLVS